MNSKFVLLVLVAVTVVAAVVGFPRVRDALSHGRQPNESGDEPMSSGTNEIDTRRRPAVVAALGRLEPSSEVLDIGASTPDRLVRLLVSENQIVKKDEELVFLEAHDEGLAEQQHISAQLHEAQNQLAAETELGLARIKEAEASITQIERLLPLKMEAQKARLAAANAELETYRKDWERLEKLKTTDSVTESDLDAAALRVRQSEESCKAAEAALEELTAQLEVDLVLANANLSRAQAALAAAKAVIPVESLQANLKLAAARLERTIIRAPIDGQVLEIFTRPGERIGPKPILQMGDTREMHAVAEVYETDVAWVSLGQRATIHSAALSDRLKGTVVQIGVMIYKNDVLDVDPAADADARVVEVRIRLDKYSLAARLTNLQVDVEIEVGADAKGAERSSE